MGLLPTCKHMHSVLLNECTSILWARHRVYQVVPVAYKLAVKVTHARRQKRFPHSVCDHDARIVSTMRGWFEVVVPDQINAQTAAHLGDVPGA